MRRHILGHRAASSLNGRRTYSHSKRFVNRAGKPDRRPCASGAEPKVEPADSRGSGEKTRSGSVEAARPVPIGPMTVECGLRQGDRRLGVAHGEKAERYAAEPVTQGEVVDRI